MSNRTQSSQSHQMANTEGDIPNHRCYGGSYVGTFTPYTPVLDRLDQVPGTAQAHPPHRTSELPWIYLEFPIEIKPNSVHTFEAVDPNLLYIGAGTPTGPNQPSNIPDPENQPSVPITTPVGPGSSGTAHEVQVQPTAREHKHQCTCQKVFDRASRLENCRNIHANEKPHRCFGRCGGPECPARYGSTEQLKRHLNRYVPCSSCGKVLAKQNMARHRASKAPCRGGR